MIMHKREIPEHLRKYFKSKTVYKPKDDAMIPHRLYEALMADGWWGRSTICWEKSNVMPSSVKDRPTTSHEYVFLLAKSKKYYYDQDAIREPHKHHRRDKWDRRCDNPNDQTDARFGNNAAGRNKRTVWTINTKPYPEAHFSTFPPALIRPMILAGSSDKACEHCGAAWVSVKTKVGEVQRRWSTNNAEGSPYNEQGGMQNVYRQNGKEPSCDCPDNTGSGVSIVCDPFAGSGTVAEVALKHRRAFTAIEPNGEYCKLIEKRVQRELSQPTFNLL